MSAERIDGWKLTLPCTKAEAEALAAREIDLPSVLITTEIDEAAGAWRLDAYFDDEPGAALIDAVRQLAPSSGWSTAIPEPLTAADWVAISQEGLEPIREGRLVVHTSAHPVDAPPGGRAFLIDAGQAFGTGHHATTAGCLAMLDRLAAEGHMVAQAIDLGTGTGLLAFAVRHLWPNARVTAADIDAVAISVTRANMTVNAIDGVELVVADGARDPAIRAGAPYDLIVANILAGPLIAMSSEVAAIAAPGATIVLAGLLTRQADTVASAYAAQGCVDVRRDIRGDWTILQLAAGATRMATPSVDADRDAWQNDG